MPTRVKASQLISLPRKSRLQLTQCWTVWTRYWTRSSSKRRDASVSSVHISGWNETKAPAPWCFATLFSSASTTRRIYARLSTVSGYLTRLRDFTASAMLLTTRSRAPRSSEKRYIQTYLLYAILLLLTNSVKQYNRIIDESMKVAEQKDQAWSAHLGLLHYVCVLPHACFKC